jgi:hypothetical protein
MNRIAVPTSRDYFNQDFIRLRRTTRVESQVVANKAEMDTKDLAR